MFRQSFITPWIAIIAACCVLIFAKRNDEQVKTVSACVLPPRVIGTCRGSFGRWSYDVEKNDCQLFEYGGCGGNDNNFESLKECKKTCEKNLAKIEALLKKKTG